MHPKKNPWLIAFELIGHSARLKSTISLVWNIDSNESNCFVLFFFFLDPITSVEIDPPHAVVVGEEAWFNVTFYTTGSPDPEEYKPSYGYVHFMWIFDNVSEPVLTLNHAVSHVFSATGQYDVTVQAISVVSLKGSHASVTVYGMCDMVT